MRHQHRPFLEPSAIRNLDKLLGGYTTHLSLKACSSKPEKAESKPYRSNP